jgi:importin-5
MCQGTNPSLREGTYRFFSGCPNPVVDLQTDAVLGVFQKGLRDRENFEVCPYTFHLVQMPHPCK